MPTWVLNLKGLTDPVICPSLNSLVRNISGIGQMIKWIFGTILVGDGCLSPCFFVFMFSRYTALKDLARSCRAGQFFELAKQPQAQLLDRVIGAHPTISHAKGCNPIILSLRAGWLCFPFLTTSLNLFDIVRECFYPKHETYPHTHTQTPRHEFVLLCFCAFPLK